MLESRRLYQRLIPLVILSAFSGLLIVQYFVPAGTALDDVRKNLLSINSTVMLMTQLFGLTTLVMWRTRMAIRRTGGRMNIFSSFVFLVFFIFFIALGLLDPEKLHGGATYSLVYQATVGALGYSATGFKFVNHSFWTFRLFASVSTVESATLFLTWLLTYLRELSVATLIFPPFALVGDWIEMFPFAAASRALLLSTAVGACVIAARALLGREPGLIDMEMVT